VGGLECPDFCIIKVNDSKTHHIMTVLIALIANFFFAQPSFETGAETGAKSNNAEYIIGENLMP
jgi:hypothetical protein